MDDSSWFLVVVGICLFVGLWFSRVGRVRRLEQSLMTLQRWHDALVWRVQWLEFAANQNRASTAYRVQASEHAVDVPVASPTPEPAMPAAPLTPLPLDARTEAPSEHHDAPDVPAALREETVPVGAPLPSEAKPAGPSIDWERWIGIRGAAALGAGILVVALFYFLRYSIEEGWLTLVHRVLLGATLSAFAVVGAQMRLKRTHVALASWMTGAGIAGVYASIWAAENVAGMIGPVTSFSLVVAVTMGAIALALRTSSLPVALLGLTGGFAAPLSLSLHGTAPLAILAYVAVLDVAMVTLAVRRRWWSLSLVSLVVSALYETMWLASVHAAGAWMHVGVLVVFAGVFGAVPAFALGEAREGEEAPPPLARLTRFGSVLVPLAFGAWLAASDAPVDRAHPLLGLVVVDWAMALGIARRRGETGLPLAVAVGIGAVLSLWIAVGGAESHSLALSAVLVFFSGSSVVLASLRRDGVGTARLSLAVSALLVVVQACVSPADIALDLGALSILAVLGFGLAQFCADNLVAKTVAPVLALASAIVALPHRGMSMWEVTALSVGGLFVVVPVVAARASKRMRGVTMSEALLAGSRASAFVLMVAVAAFAPDLPIGAVALFATVAAIVLVTSKSAHLGTYVTGGVLLAGTFAIHSVLGPRAGTLAESLVPLLIGLAYVAVPLVPGAGYLARIETPRGQAIAVVAFGASIGAWPVAHGSDPGLFLAAVALVACALLVTLRAVADDARVRECGLVWLGGLGLGATTLALTLSTDHETRTGGFALVGLVLVALHRRERRPAIALLGVAHLGIASLGLVLNPNVLAWHPRGTTPVVDWITPAYLFPAACAFGAWRVLEGGRPALTSFRRACAAMGFVLTFAWLNLAVLDVYSVGSELSFQASAGQGRDLAMSVSWALFGLILLVIGMRRHASIPRKASLAIILATAAKVFLYDLSALGNLYRVASLVGLAISLLAISLLYQHFVFSERRASP